MLFALLGIVAGVVGWLWVWSIGLISAAIAYLMCLAILWLYRKGARVQDELDRKSAIIITVMVVVGLLASIFAAMVFDLIRGLMMISVTAQTAGVVQLLLHGGFWVFVFTNLVNPDFLKIYADSITWSVILALIGVYTTVGRVLMSTTKPNTARAQRPVMETHRRLTYVMSGFLFALTFVPVYQLANGSMTNLYHIAQTATYVYFAPGLYAYAFYAGTKLQRTGMFYAQAALIAGIVLTVIAAATTTTNPLVSENTFIQIVNSLNGLALLAAVYVIFRMLVPPSAKGFEADIEAKLRAQYAPKKRD